MEAAPTPSMALCFFGITADSVSQPSDSIRRSLETPCCSVGKGCVAPEEDGAVADGNDIESVLAALSEPTEPGKPKAILSHTVKGKGVSFMENQVGWHGKAPNEEQRSQALKELEG